jgi:dihydrofolate reductase
MGRLIVSVQMTLDGVIDRVDEWFDGAGEHQVAAREELFAADALLLGRVTYEGLSRAWPTMTDSSGYADRVNSLPKYVASRTLAGPLAWNATLLTGELAAGVVALKRQLAGDLVSYGCGELAHDLVGLGLVDEVRVGVHPVSFGPGTRLFAGRGPVRLAALGTTAFASGVTLLRYRPVVGGGA